MALYRWRCEECGEVTRKMLASRPRLDDCSTCGGRLFFVTNTQAMVMETLDSGLMPRKVEQIKDVSEMREKRSNQDLKKGPGDGGLV